MFSESSQRNIAIDLDTTVMEHTGDAVLGASGAACAAVDAVVEGRTVNAFCNVRPPGHHAEPDKSMGFCYVNHIAVAAHHARNKHGIKKVAVVDFDVHHGNGTQEAFFSDPNFFYASTHQGRFYPGTGLSHERGVAKNIVNVPLSVGSGSKQFREAFSSVIAPALLEWRPGLLLISAGFDAHKDDPLAGLRLKDEDFEWTTALLCRVAAEVCEGRVVSLLEGGYNLTALERCSLAHVNALVCAGNLAR